MAKSAKKQKGYSVDRGAYKVRWSEGNKRLGISLSEQKFSEATVEELCRYIKKLVYYKQNPLEVPDKKMKGWLESANPIILAKLAEAGLIIIPKSHTVGELWTAYLKEVERIEDSTRDLYERSKGYFFLFFKEKEVLTDLEKVRLEEWKDFLLTQKGLSESTVAGAIAKAKAVFNWAVKRKWLAASPFKDLACGEYENRKNDRFVEMTHYYRLLDACDCQEWRTIISLARIGGLRAPSEVMRLRWEDINWEGNQFYVRPLPSRNPKRKKGKEGRWTPLFPELRDELEKLFLSDESEGTYFVINRYPKRAKTNLGTQFDRIGKRAGLEKFPRPFDNMRASRSTEIDEQFGAYRESLWIGHSIKIARKHYIQIRERDYAKAASWSTPVTAPAPAGAIPSRGVDLVGESVIGQENHFPTNHFGFPTTAKNVSDHVSDRQGAVISRKEPQQEKMKAS